MKVYLQPPRVNSLSLKRVARALTQYKPDWVEIVDSEADADLVVLHVIGRQDQILKQAAKTKSYAVIQYAIRSTMRPETEGWIPLWQNAKLVWSYYDLPYLCYEDGSSHWFPFYHAPLGVDERFIAEERDREFRIMTSGQSYLTESVRECIIAARETDGLIFHLGDELNQEKTFCMTGIPDGALIDVYSRCQYVSGLRRIEGFELPAAEGLLCGARPIMFDKPHYGQWFSDFAIFIPENSRQEVIQSLKNVFLSEYVPVSQEEIEAARKLFNWKTIVEGFWKGLS